VSLLGASAHAGGEDAEVGKLLLAAGGDRFQAIVLDFETCKELLAVLLEPLRQKLDAAGEHRGAAGAVGSEGDSRFSEDVVKVGLELIGSPLDRLFPLLTAAVRVKGQADDGGDDQRVNDRDRRERRRKDSSLAAEALLPEQEERLAHRLGIASDVAL